MSRSMALLAVIGAAACQEAPSYQLRWELEGYQEISAATCAQTGVLSVQVRAYALPTLDSPNLEEHVRDEMVVPCQDAALDRTVAGPTLPPGDYAIQVRGVDRTVSPWTDGTTGRITLDARGEGNGCGSTSTGTQECGPAAPFCVIADSRNCHDGSLTDPCDDDGQCQEPFVCNGDNVCEYVTGCDLDTDYDRCVGDQLVCACQRLTVTAKDAPAPADVISVEEGSTVELLPFALVPPPECMDGIDNDNDGLVDGLDPACGVSFGDGTEGLPVGITEVQLDVSLLGNIVTNCTSNLGRIQLVVDSEQGSEVLIDDTCHLDQAYFASVRLPPGPATFSVTGFDPCRESSCRDDPYCMGIQPECFPSYCAEYHAVCGAYGLSRDECGGPGGFDAPECFEPVSDAATVTKQTVAEISPTGGTVHLEVDFGPNDFIEPIRSAIRALPGYVSERGIGAQVRYSCDPPTIGSVGTRGLLALDQLRVQLLNGHGTPLPYPVALDDGTIIDGPTTIDCRTALTTEELEWGSYSLVVEALSPEGEVCFSNADRAVFPSPESLSPLLLPRVYLDGGTVPDSCHDCETDADCGLETLRCVNNVCHGQCGDPGDEDEITEEDHEDCRDPVFGELGFVCRDDHFCAPEG